MTDKPTYEDWKPLADKEVKGRDLTWHTPEGIAVKPLYTSEDTAALVDPGVPGIAPFNRQQGSARRRPPRGRPAGTTGARKPRRRS